MKHDNKNALGSEKKLNKSSKKLPAIVLVAGMLAVSVATHQGDSEPGTQSEQNMITVPQKGGGEQTLPQKGGGYNFEFTGNKGGQIVVTNTILQKGGGSEVSASKGGNSEAYAPNRGAGDQYYRDGREIVEVASETLEFLSEPGRNEALSNYMAGIAETIIANQEQLGLGVYNAETGEKVDDLASYRGKVNVQNNEKNLDGHYIFMTMDSYPKGYDFTSVERISIGTGGDNPDGTGAYKETSFYKNGEGDVIVENTNGMRLENKGGMSTEGSNRLVGDDLANQDSRIANQAGLIASVTFNKLGVETTLPDFSFSLNS